MPGIDDILGFATQFGGHEMQHASNTSTVGSQGNTAKTLESMAGSAIGNALLPGIGGQIGSVAAPMIIGGIQSLLGGAKKKKAAGMAPSAEDPMERRRLQELDSMRKSMETGSAYASQLKQLKNIQSNTMSGARRAAGGQVGALLSTFSRIGAQTGETYGQIAEEGEKRKSMYDMAYGDLVSKMAERRGALQMQKYTQESQDAAQQKTAGNQLLMNALSTGLGNIKF